MKAFDQARCEFVDVDPNTGERLVARKADLVGPTRPFTIPTDPKERKKIPLASGLFDYFPDALVAVANLSYVGNEQHNPGQDLHWARNKSTDESDTILRHFAERGSIDTDGVRHSTKVAWRALALLQKEIEDAAGRKVA